VLATWQKDQGLSNGGIHTIDVAKTTGLALLGVMQTASPIDGDVALLAVEASRALHATACADAAELEEAIEDGAVVADVVLALLSHKGVHIVGRDLLKEFDVLVGVELRHLGRDGRLRTLF
jgi:hypothetical protein